MKRELTTAERIERAKGNIDGGAAPHYAIAHALIAIAELLQTNISEAYIEGVKVGAEAAGQAVSVAMFGPSNSCAKPEPEQVRDPR